MNSSLHAHTPDMKTLTYTEMHMERVRQKDTEEQRHTERTERWR